MKRLHLAISLLVVPISFRATAGTFSFSPFGGDADSGVSPGLSYTALADFAGTGTRVVNGVAFTSSAASGPTYSLGGGAGTDFTGFGNSATGGSNGLLSDFRYTGDGSGNASLTLSGLTVGQTYVTSWYNAAFGNPGGRVVDVIPSDTGVPFRFDENYTNAGNGNILRYTFTATSPTITYNFDAVTNGDSFHHYAFSNAVANNSLLSTPVVTAVTGPGPISPFTVRNNDLLQTNLAGVTSSDPAAFQIELSGGLPILNNGLFTISGGNPGDNTQLATVNNDAFVEFTLNTSVNALGYDISSLELYGGWNDSGRDRQLFKVLYSLVGSPDFTFFGAVDNNPAAGGDPSAVRTVFDASLTGVDAIRIEFFGLQENGYAGLGEVDVVGTPTVPEPGTAVLLLLGTTLAVRRRRS